MLNLLPENQKKSVLLEYRTRLGIVIALCITLISICGLIFIAPTYLISEKRHSEIKVKNDEVLINLSSKNSSQNAEVKKITQGIAVLSNLGANVLPSELFEKFLSYADSKKIQVSRLSYSLNTDNSIVFNVSGVGADRDSLSVFIQNLKNDSYFSQVSLPLSSFVKQKDIDFSLKIVVPANATSTKK